MSNFRLSLERLLLWIVLLMVTLSPWPFGCVHPEFELFLSHFVVAIGVLWCGMLIWNENLLGCSLQRAGVPGLFLLLLTAVVAIPLLPIPSGWTDAVSPSVGAWTAKTSPPFREKLAAVAEKPKSQDFASRSSKQIDPEPMESNSMENIEPPASALLAGGLSLNPAGNLQLFFRLGALSLLFLALSGIGRADSALRELAWVATVVGTALALVAILQSISPGKNEIYWFFESKGSEYGPFLNKNHYPFFANLAIGLTIGLLLERWSACGLSWAILFRDSSSLWLLASLSLQLASLAMSLSRGGVSALIVAFFVCMILRAKSTPAAPILFASIFLGGIAVAMMSWAGFDILESRLVTLTEADTYREDGRWYLWRVAVMVFNEFPIFGSGGETYRHWQTIIQFGGTWNSSETFAHRADNEYLDVLCEHGVFAFLALAGLVVSLLVTCGRQAREKGIVAGAFIALLSVSVHSFVDFGLRVPASAVFVVVTAALANAARPSTGSHKVLQSNQSGSSTMSRILWPMMSIAAIFVIFFFLNHFLQAKQRWAQAERHRLAAYLAVSQKDTDRVVTEIESMVRATPEDVLAHLEYARIALLASKFASPPVATNLKREMVRHCVQLRDLCPLVWESPFWISQNMEQLASVDMGAAVNTTRDKVARVKAEQAAVDYLRIAHLLHPSNSTISYMLGVELFDRAIDFDGAMDAWRASLLYSPRYLREILTRALTKFTPAEVLNRILPANASTLMSAVMMLESLGHGQAKEDFLSRAAEVIDQSIPMVKRRDLHATYAQAADIQSKLGKLDRAVEFSRLAIANDSMRVAVRFQLVGYLINLRRLEEAKLELNRLQSIEPSNPQIVQFRKQIFDIEHPRVK